MECVLGGNFLTGLNQNKNVAQAYLPFWPRCVDTMDLRPWTWECADDGESMLAMLF